VLKVKPAPKEIQELKGHRVKLEHRGLKELKVQKEIKVILLLLKN